MTDRLNPEALDHAVDALSALWDENGYYGSAEDLARTALTAYLDALPAPRTIKTVEQLDALPVGAVVYAANHIGPTERFTVGWMGCGNAAAWSSAVLARDGLPARVLHVTTEGSGE